MGTDIHAVFQRKTESGWEDVETQYDEDRHYALFAWIGDVRNGFGFAGVPTHNRIDPLSGCRGFPDDFAIVDGEYHLEKWIGDHSHSWLLADEIINAKPPRILRTGIVDVSFFRSWDGESQPNSYCGGISGQNVFVSEPSEVNDKTTHVQIEWFDDTEESFSYFVDEVKR